MMILFRIFIMPLVLMTFRQRNLSQATNCQQADQQGSKQLLKEGSE